MHHVPFPECYTLSTILTRQQTGISPLISSPAWRPFPSNKTSPAAVTQADTRAASRVSSTRLPIS